MKTQADLRHQNENYEFGDKVFLNIRPYRHHLLAKRRNEKLASIFYGPFDITWKVGKVAYKLKLLNTAKIHPVVHVFDRPPLIFVYSRRNKE